MNDAGSSVIAIEAVAIGDKQSRLSFAIVVLLCVIPSLATVLFGGVDSITWILLTALSLAMIVLWLIETWRAKGLLLNTSALTLPLIGLLVVGIVQMLPVGPGGNTLTLDPYATQLFVTQLLLLSVYLVACLTFINSEKRLRAVVVFVLIFGAAMAFVGILQHLASPDTLYGRSLPSQSVPFGPFVNQHHFAAFMEMIGGLAIGLLFGSTAKDKKVLVAIALVIMVVALVLTGSRGGMLSFTALTIFATMLNFLYRKAKPSDEPRSTKRKLVIAGGVLTIVIGILGTILFLGADESLTRGIGLSNAPAEVSNGRLHFWSVALNMFWDHPVIGVGLDAFGVAFTKYDTWNGVFRIERAHNDYLQTLAEAGIVGLGLVLAFIYFLFRKGMRVVASAGTGFRRDVVIGALAGCFGILVHSFFDFPLRTWSNSFFFLMLAAIATVSIRASTEQSTHKRRKRRPSAP
jgi:O-antigen ligase